jgi:hypothetical protein
VILTVALRRNRRIEAMRRCHASTADDEFYRCPQLTDSIASRIQI